MGTILRQPSSAASEIYDLIIIGGGIYGVMLAFEASWRGIKSLLLERTDFGGATTFNCLRILHGGLRYLQTMDLHRFRESVAERRWFLKTLPDWVKPLPCLMPLYGNGLRRPFVLRAATLINDVLSHNRNEGVWPGNHLPASKVISAKQTREIFPSIEMKGLQGGVIWYDAYMPDSQLILIEILRWACENGATALNYVEARQLLKTKTDVAGVITTDLENAETFEYRANCVVNAAGPWCREVAARFDRDEPKLFRSSLAWNMLLDRPSPSTSALAVAPKKRKAQTYFLLPWKGKLLVGTGHSPWLNSVENPMPSGELIQEFLDDINLAVPALGVNQKDILHVFAGLLPATKVGTADLSDREVILNHAKHDGPKGLYTISGVKFTTSRLAAQKTLKRIFPENALNDSTHGQDFRPFRKEGNNRKIFDFDQYHSPRDQKWKEGLHLLIQEEAVQHLDDLIYRRTSLWENPERALEVARDICPVFKWDQSRCRHELERLEALLTGNDL